MIVELEKPLAAVYEEDYQVWCERNLDLLRAERWDQVDLENLIEELDGLAKRDRAELLNRVSLILVHLLKWQFQSAKRSTSWRRTIATQRGVVERLLEDSPSLRRRLRQNLARTYVQSVRAAAAETKLDVKTFPNDCPYTEEQILTLEYFPR